MLKVKDLRKKYPKFLYKGYSFVRQNGNLKISFDFSVPPDIQFHPTILIQNVTQKDIEKVGKLTLNNIVFNLGLVEMISYWKATCSPKIIIEAGYLSKEQIAWWKDLILNGMGEYFYMNKINFTNPNFLTITASVVSPRLSLGTPRLSLGNKTMIPVGGGKDAVVTLELLQQARMPLVPLILNPKKEQLDILKIARLKNPIVVTRTIDPKLLELNRKGYLNGHTPFSAYLAFLSVLCGTLFNTKYIALSNERSSNEGNVKYLGKTINHQYSKTFDFEKKFRSYVKTYLTKDIEYFSFLRPLYELQIAKIFAQYPKYFLVFLSCNEAHKTKSGTKKPKGEWCGKCSKCLFVWLMLRPFIQEKQLLAIFKRNLLEDKTLTPIIEELTGKRRFKPFECVGTFKESKAALSLHIDSLVSSWNKNHFLPPRFSQILTEAKKRATL